MGFERSLHTDRVLQRPRPRLRGRSHALALLASVPAGLWLVAEAPPGAARLGAGAFVLGLVVMFAMSALLHHRRWSAEAYEVLFRLDHTGILLLFGGTATAVALLGLGGWLQALLLIGMWISVVVAAVAVWLPFALPRGTANTAFLVMGWMVAPFVPPLVVRNGWLPVLLLAAGGLLYTVGAVIVGRQRPDPAPEVFGYHEIFHLLVIVAVALHFVAVVLLLPG